MTGFTSNINDVIAKFQRFSENIDASDALAAGVNAAKAAMQNRIFNQGLDSNGKPFGKYKGKKKSGLGKGLTSKVFGLDQKTKERTVGFIDFTRRFSPYELKRLNAGRQIVFKDLELTGSLRRGIVTIKQNNRVVCAIPNEKLYFIARAQEKQLGTKIFSMSEREREIMTTTTNALLKQQYDRFNSTK